MVSAIVCIDKNYGIGFDGKLLDSIPEDMRFFRNKTKNSVVIMGRNTYNSLPSKPLPNRVNIVVTSKINNLYEIDENNTFFVTMDFIKTFLQTLSNKNPINYYIIGGGKIYKELLPYCKKAYITKINYSYRNVDTYFPNIDDMSEWHIEEKSEIKEDNSLEYQFFTYAIKE